MDVSDQIATARRQDTPLGGSGDARLARAFELVAEPAVAVLSLDIFDTLLWRRCPDPVDAFPAIGDRLLREGRLPAHIDPIAFKKLRIAAEWRARAARPVAEITLDEIYQELPARMVAHIPPEQLGAIELEVERSVLVPDLDVRELVRFARSLGKTVIAVSDTYLSEPELRSLLDPHFTLEAAIDRVFASSAHREGKGSGLFEIVLRELGRSAHEIVHVGDNEAADVEAPRKVGIRAVHFERRPKYLERLREREHRYSYEERLWPHGDFGLTALRGKVAHRREAADLPAELHPFWTYGALALGPVFTGFAEWVHYRAGVAGVSKVFCLMREGELMAKLIRAAGGYLGSDLGAEPLWLSRQVCARALIIEGTDDELRTLLGRRRAPTVAGLCETLHVDIEASPLLMRSASARLNEGALVEEVLGELTTNPELRGPMLDGAEALRRRIVAYVLSKLPPGEQNLGLVDLGWAGTIQKLLQEILHYEGHAIFPLGLYMVTQDLAVERTLDDHEIVGYLANCGVPNVPMRSVMRSPEILEQVCMPDVGSQIDLTADFEPVLSEAIDLERAQSAERGAAQAGILAFQREWIRYADLTDGHPSLLETDARRLLLAQLVRASVAPTDGEARVFSSWIHDENYGSTESEPIVGGEHARRALRHMDPEALIATPMSELYWPFGLAALEDEHLAAAAEAVSMDVVPAGAFRSLLETGDFEVYYDNGYGFYGPWREAIKPARNRFGLSYVRAEVRADELRAIRVDPVKAPCALRIDWISLTCWVRGDSAPRVVVFDTAEALDRFSQRGLEPLAPKLWLVTGNDPQLELDLRDAVGEGVHRATVECGFAVMPAAARGADPHTVELRRRGERRSRALKRMVREAEARTGLPIAGPLRKAWRRARARLG